MATSTPTELKKGPLDGVTVLDFSRVLAGPYCTMVLADLGARVIKVEKIGTGDDTREFGPFIEGESAYFSCFNRNKESIVLDIKSPRDRELLERLLDDPDLQSKMDQIEARDRTLPIFAEAIAGYEYATLETAFEAGGIPFSPINRPAEMYDDPHVMRPGGLHQSHFPDGQSFRAPGLPIEVDGTTPAPASLDVSAVGADTEVVLSGLGLSAEDIATARGTAKVKAA